MTFRVKSLQIDVYFMLTMPLTMLLWKMEKEVKYSKKIIYFQKDEPFF